MAHRSSYHLTSPVESSRLIWEVVEIVNRTWGERTPGGRIFPLPADRHVFAIGWAPDGNTISRVWADQLANFDHKDWQFILVLGVDADEDLFRFDSNFETTRFPATLLWGPGSQSEAVARLAETRPSGDQAEYLDRRFFVRADRGTIDPPRNEEQFLASQPNSREGSWYLVEADMPVDAFMHVRSLVTGSGNCTPVGPCKNCWATTKMYGEWDLLRLNLPGSPSPVGQREAVAVPERWRRWT